MTAPFEFLALMAHGLGDGHLLYSATLSEDNVWRSGRFDEVWALSKE